MKKVLVCFDGTANEPKDAEQEKAKGGQLEDDNISNVLKLHFLAGGGLDNQQQQIEGQRSLYYSGVGTRGSIFRRIVRKAFASRGPDVIINEALRDLEQIYEDKDRLYLFGFSRGAAIARMFAALISRNGLQTRNGTVDWNPAIEMLGVWDTVAAFGKPNLSARTRPLSDVVFENGSIASNIRNAYHLVSVDENRLAFRPTLMNFEPRVTEVWFPGVHSDVGGGYRIDGLSDITLKFMCDKAKLHGLKFLRTEDIPMEILSGIDADGKRVEIDRDDIEIKPDSRAQIHYHEEKWRTPLLARRTLAPREIIVMQKDLPSDRVPIVHHTVFKRAKADKDYRPDSLWNIEHRAINTKNGSMLLYNGLEDHLRAS